MITDEEKIFRRDYLFSREDILQSLDLMVDYIENDPETGYTKALIENKLTLYKQFYQRVEKSIFPELTELYWYYSYDYSGTGIDLWLCSGEDIELSEEKDYMSTMTGTSEQLLIHVGCDYVSPDEFAAILEVSPATVKQWIRKGILRYAKYIDGNWLIPSTAEKPNRNYGFIQYTIDTDDPPIIEEFPIISACDSITIYKDGKQLICDVDNWKIKFHQKMVLTREEVERLEYSLIKSGKATPEIPVQFVVSLHRDE